MPRDAKGRFIAGPRPEVALEKNPAWRGGRRADDKGYIRVAVGKKRWAYEHRLVIEASLGRKLKRWEQVHHKNGNKQDNRPENLELMSVSDHARLHARVSPLVTKPCAICDVAITRKAHRFGNKRAICSKACLREDMRRRNPGAAYWASVKSR